MNIIYVSFLYPEKLKEELINLGSLIDYPGDKFQHGLLRGLSAVEPNISVVSSAFMSAYPRVKKIYFKPEAYSINEGKIRGYYVGGFNIPGLKFVSEFLRIRKDIKKHLSKTEENVVILYELHSPFMLAVKSLKRRIDASCLVVPDLPEFMTEKKSPLYRLAKKVDRQIIDRSTKAFDSFVLFSPHMKERLKVGNKPWCNVEGVYSEPDKETMAKKDPKKVILFTGALTKRVGIPELLEAFEGISDPDYRLWIRGDGQTIKELVLQKAKQDSRIVYFERMSANELSKLQKKATVLINPVKPVEEYTRYFFPSKTMEYLASGTPTIMYKLDCLPHDYYNHIYFVEDETVEGLRKTIVDVCSKSQEELKAFGQQASEFILQEKNPIAQASKMLNMIKTECLIKKQ